LAGLIFWRKKKEDKAQVSETSVVEPLVNETALEAEPIEAEIFFETDSDEPAEEVVEVLVAPEVPELVIFQEPALEAVELPKRKFASGIKSLFSRIKFDLENLNELEDILIQADFGVDAAEQIVAKNAELAANNKTKAVDILNTTDWTAIASIADPTESNPYLTNRPEFLTYRSIVRQIAIAPTFDAVFPTEPTESWSS
jgi:signal recognition particle GTPase